VTRRGAAALVLLVAIPGTWILAQEREPSGTEPRGAGDPELRERLFGYFEKRLRVDLELSDEQVAEILPRVRQMERERGAMSREKRAAMMKLRRAYREGASDEELETHMGRVEEIDSRMRARMRTLMGEMDRSLSVRQRIEFRSFLERFRSEIRDRVEQLRRQSGEPMRRRRPPQGPRSDPSSPRPR
jgi:hypothetical protein